MPKGTFDACEKLRNISTFLGDSTLTAEKLLLDGVVAIVLGIVKSTTAIATQNYFQQRRVESSIESAIANVVEPLGDFFEAEQVEGDAQFAIIDSVMADLDFLKSDSTVLFEVSLDGQKLFDRLYGQAGAPKAIIEFGVQNLYEMVFVRIVTVICSIPVAVKDWEANAWKENYLTLDRIAEDIKGIFERLNSAFGQVGSDADQSIVSIKKIIDQRITLQLDLTGLRADRPISGTIDDYYVSPSFAFKL